MKCMDIQKILPAYHEGIASSNEKEGVENHLSSCQVCRKVFEELKRIDALVKGLEQVETPPWFTQKIMSRVRAEQESKKNLIQRLFYPLHIKVPLEAFATVLIAVAAVYLFSATAPKMKRIDVPAATEETVSKDEVSRQSAETKGDTVILGGKVGLEGVPKPQKQEGATRDKDQQSPVPPTSETPSPPVLEMKTEPPEKPSGPSELSSQHAQAYRQSPIPAGVEQETDSAAKAPARGEKVERRALSAAPQVTALTGTKPGTIDVTLQTPDARVASRDVENILNQLGAQNIRKESLQNTEILRAEFQAEKTRELLEKLRLLGEVKEKGLSSDLPQGTIMIRIEMMSSP